MKVLVLKKKIKYYRKIVTGVYNYGCKLGNGA
jgi:hypothetical protein